MTTPQPLPYAIIGGGLMGREIASATARWCHLSNTGVLPRLAAVCDTNPAALAWFQSNFDIPLVTADYRAVLDDPSVKAVYCAVPHDLHESLYVDTIRAGKHLLGEKPFGIDLPAASRILDAVRCAPDTVVRCSSEYPFFPAVQRILQAIRDQRFGTILEVDVGFLHSSDMNPLKPINWKRMVRHCGEYGVMGDLGLHVFHVPLRVGWQPANVRAILTKAVPERPDAHGNLVPCETWDNAALFCEIPCPTGAFPLTARVQRIAPGETNTWYISVKGTQFSARFSTKKPRSLESMPYDPAQPQQWRTEDLGPQSVYPSITGGIFEFGFSDSLQQMFAAFCDQAAHGPAHPVPFSCATPEEALVTHRIFTAALESHRNRSTVAL